MSENKKQLSVPDGWHEVTIDQFQEIASLTNTGTERTIDVMSILLNEDPELIKKLDIPTLTKLINMLSWTNDMPSDAIYKPIIRIDEDEYGLVSKLEQLTTGEWIDIESYITEDAIQNLHKIMSILYRPLITAFNDRDRIVEEYDANVADRQSKIFKDKVKITDVYGCLVFFSLIEKEYIKIMTDYLQTEQTKMTMKNLENLTKNERLD